MAVCVLRSPLSFAILCHKRLPIVATRKADRGQGEGQKEEISSRGQHRKGQATEDGLTEMTSSPYDLCSFCETVLAYSAA